jgi:hypothetical protein
MIVIINEPNTEGKRDFIKIDPWDSWNGDNTIARIAAPIVKQLMETKQGAPHVDNEDVPESLHMTPEAYKEYSEDGRTDEDWFKRYDYVLGEIYWGLNELATDQKEYYANFDHTEVDESLPLMDQVNQVKIDKVALEMYDRRMKNSLRLFGKYFQSLWD